MEEIPSDIFDNGLVTEPLENTNPPLDKEDYIKICIESFLEIDVATFFKWHQGRKYFLHGSKLYKFGMFGWNTHLDEELKQDLRNIANLLKDYREVLKEFINSTDGDGKAEREMVSSIDVFLSKRYFYNHAFLTRCVKSFKGLCSCIENVEINAFKFCFDNCTFDLNSNSFVDVVKEDYCIMSTGYNYNKPTKEQLEEVALIITTTLPDKKKRKFVMEHIASGLCGKVVDTFLFARGNGGNGKSILYLLARDTFGNYALEMDSDVLCHNIRNGSDNVNNAILNMEHKRFITTTEPSHTTRFNASTIKKLTGGESVTSRRAHGYNHTISIKGTFAAQCNTMPSIDNVDGGIERRIVVVDFSEKIADPNIKLKDIAYRANLCSAFFNVLIPYWRCYKEWI